MSQLLMTVADPVDCVSHHPVLNDKGQKLFTVVSLSLVSAVLPCLSLSLCLCDVGMTHLSLLRHKWDAPEISSHSCAPPRVRRILKNELPQLLQLLQICITASMKLFEIFAGKYFAFSGHLLTTSPVRKGLH